MFLQIVNILRRLHIVFIEKLPRSLLYHLHNIEPFGIIPTKKTYCNYAIWDLSVGSSPDIFSASWFSHQCRALVPRLWRKSAPIMKNIEIAYHYKLSKTMLQISVFIFQQTKTLSSEMLGSVFLYSFPFVFS